GLIGDIVKAIAPETEADAAGILIQLLVAIGNAIGRSPYFQVGTSKHHANLFAALIGGTACGKEQALSITMSVMETADAEWFRHAVHNGLSSGEGMIECVCDAEMSMNGTVVSASGGATEKRLMCVETEFSKPLKAMRRDGNTLSEVLRQAWDGRRLEVMNRKDNALQATDAHVSVIAHCTAEELHHLLVGKVEMVNGWCNRFLWVLVRRTKLLPSGGNASVLDVFRKPFADAIAKAKGIGRMERSADAESYWEGIYPSLVSDVAGAYGASIGRARPIVVRLSMVYALVDGTPTIGVEHLHAAMAVWRYCEASARFLFDATASAVASEVSLAERLFALIVQTKGISKTQLHEATGKKFTAKQLSEALASLEAEGKVQAEMETTGGRPAEVWLATARTKEESMQSPKHAEVHVEEIPVVHADDLAKDTSFVRTPEPEKHASASASPGGKGIDCTVPANATPWWGILFQGQQCINGVPLCEINRQPDAFIPGA
ncbi:MAG: DUF3987 domain-containing protein, partial [Planctomycetia bacterium]|nr:DUF3987 domain-containing protein [Planctomycetia bacterium]